MNNQYCNPKYQSAYLQRTLYQYQCAYDRDQNPPYQVAMTQYNIV